MSAFLSLRLFLVESRGERATMLLALGLSLTLFGLTTIEALPTSRQSLFSHEGTLSFFYWCALWLLSIQIILVVPSLVGSSIGKSFGHYFCCTSSSGGKKRHLFESSRLPWWIRFAWKLGAGLVFMVLKNVVYNGLFWCFAGRRRRMPIDSSTLPLQDESSLRRSPSAEIRDDLPSLDSSSSHSQSIHQGHSQSQHRSFVMAGGTCGIIFTVAFLSTMGPLVVQPSSEDGSTLLALIVSWICALGLIISSILNGFGSVSLPYTTLSGLFLQQVKPDCIGKLEASLRSMEDALAKKRTMLKELKVEIPTLMHPSRGTSRSSKTQTSSNTFSISSLLPQNNASATFSELGDELRIRKQILQSEIGFMEDLIRETTLDIEELKYSQLTAAAARTSMGRTKSYVGLLFSMILLVRLANAGYSIFRSYGTLLNTNYASHHHHHKKSRSDVITSVLLWMTGHNYFSNNQYNTLSQMVSLVLSAVLSFTQVRTFLRTATIVHRRLSGFCKMVISDGDHSLDFFQKESLGQTPSTVSILGPIISSFLGCYSLACIVLIKMMLPERYSVAFSVALDESGMFTIHSSIVNTVFFSSAVLSACIFGMLLGIQRQNISKHADIILSPRGSTSILPDV